MKTALAVAIIAVLYTVTLTYFGVKLYRTIRPSAATTAPSITSDTQLVTAEIQAQLSTLEELAHPAGAGLNGSTPSRDEIEAAQKRLQSRLNEIDRLTQERAARAETQTEANVQAERKSNLFSALLTVVVIFILTLGIVWTLARIPGGPLNAIVKASIKKAGGSIWITASGIVGCFLAIAIVGVASVYFLAKGL